jgi:hypothetical protein
MCLRELGRGQRWAQVFSARGVGLSRRRLIRGRRHQFRSALRARQPLGDQKLATLNTGEHENAAMLLMQFFCVKKWAHL